MTTAAIYARVSREEQAKKGTSIKTQLADLAAYAGREGLETAGLADPAATLVVVAPVEVGEELVLSGRKQPGQLHWVSPVLASSWG